MGFFLKENRKSSPGHLRPEGWSDFDAIAISEAIANVFLPSPQRGGLFATRSRRRDAAAAKTPTLAAVQKHIVSAITIVS